MRHTVKVKLRFNCLFNDKIKNNTFTLSLAQWRSMMLNGAWLKSIEQIVRWGI